MSRGATARLFAAVDLPAPVRAELARWGRSAASNARRSGGRLRLLDPEAMHLTLCFLGERPTEEIEALGAALAAACAEAAPVGRLELGAPVWLPRRHPRALAVEVHDDADGALAALQGVVVRALAAVSDFEVERRRFRPHVTVARVRSRDAPDDRGLPATPGLALAPRSVTLHRSWLTPTEAIYEALATCALAPASV